MFKSLLKLVTPAFSYTSASRKSQFIGHYMPHRGAVPCSAEKATARRTNALTGLETTPLDSGK